MFWASFYSPYRHSYRVIIPRHLSLLIFSLFSRVCFCVHCLIFSSVHSKKRLERDLFTCRNQTNEKKYINRKTKASGRIIFVFPLSDLLSFDASSKTFYSTRFTPSVSQRRYRNYALTRRPYIYCIQYIQSTSNMYCFSKVYQKVYSIQKDNL